jgi:hypothetical protein
MGPVRLCTPRGEPVTGSPAESEKPVIIIGDLVSIVPMDAPNSLSLA